MRKQEKLLIKLASSKDKNKTANYKKQLSNAVNKGAIKSNHKVAKSWLKKIGKGAIINEN